MRSEYGRLLRNARLGTIPKQSLREAAARIRRSVGHLADVEAGNRGPLPPAQTRALAVSYGVDAAPLLVAAAEARGAVQLDVTESEMHRTLGARLAGAWDLLTAAEMAKLLQTLDGMRLPDGARKVNHG